LELKTRLPFENAILEASLAIFFEPEDFSDQPWILIKSNILFQGEIKRFSCAYYGYRVEYKRSTNSIVKFWKDLSGQYPMMTELARSVLVLPHTTAPVERIFAQMKDFVPPKRNRLHRKTLEANLLIHQLQEDFGGCDFEITDLL